MNKSVFSGDVAPGNSGAFLCALFRESEWTLIVSRNLHIIISANTSLDWTLLSWALVVIHKSQGNSSNPAGSGYPVPWMASLNHPWSLDSGNPCRNDGLEHNVYKDVSLAEVLRTNHIPYIQIFSV